MTRKAANASNCTFASRTSKRKNSASRVQPRSGASFLAPENEVTSPMKFSPAVPIDPDKFVAALEYANEVAERRIPDSVVLPQSEKGGVINIEPDGAIQ